MSGVNTVNLQDDTFDENVLKSPVPVLVDFWAVWCGPCKMMGPIVDEIADEYVGKVKVGKLDVDSNPTSASRFHVRGIPTLLLFKNGSVVEEIVGAVGKEKVATMLNSHV